MSRPPHWGNWYWEEFDPNRNSSSADLATLRKAVNRDPGSVPELWRFYRVIVPESVAASGTNSPRLAAEHATLGLFGLHQQSQRKTMHSANAWFGDALHKLRLSDKYSGEAVDRRVNAAATATSPGELVMHLRGLITQLRAVSEPLDYSQLIEDIYDWNHDERRQRVRRRWGAQYYRWADQDRTTSEV
jgi:CRISPR system Cascade subunit CasB